MSTENALAVNINVYQAIDFYADVFQVENSETMIDSKHTLDPDIIVFNNELNRYDKLKENGLVELEKMTKGFYQAEIHKVI